MRKLYKNTALPPSDLHAWPPLFGYHAAVPQKWLESGGAWQRHTSEGPSEAQLCHLVAAPSWRLTSFLTCERKLNKKTQLTSVLVRKKWESRMQEPLGYYKRILQTSHLRGEKDCPDILDVGFNVAL